MITTMVYHLRMPLPPMPPAWQGARAEVMSRLAIPLEWQVERAIVGPPFYGASAEIADEVSAEWLTDYLALVDSDEIDWVDPEHLPTYSDDWN